MAYLLGAEWWNKFIPCMRKYIPLWGCVIHKEVLNLIHHPTTPHEQKEDPKS